MTPQAERIARAIDSVLGEDHESLSIEMGFGRSAKKWREEAMLKAAEAVLAVLRETAGKSAP